MPPDTSFVQQTEWDLKMSRLVLQEQHYSSVVWKVTIWEGKYGYRSFHSKDFSLSNGAP